MHPALRPYYDYVIPVFWPWLWLNLVRFALWHLRTGRDALLAVDCFGNIRIVRLSDEPAPDDLYTYEAPLMPRWERPALASDLPDSLPVQGGGPLIRSLYGVYTVFYMVRERVRGPPRDHPPRKRGRIRTSPHRTATAAPAFRAGRNTMSPLAPSGTHTTPLIRHAGDALRNSRSPVSVLQASPANGGNCGAAPLPRPSLCR